MTQSPLSLSRSLLLALFLSGCASSSSRSDTLSYTSDVRKQSYADNTLFHDLVDGIGGVGFADQAFYKDARLRQLVKIDAVIRYSGKDIGEERWTIKHDDGSTVSYTVGLVPDFRGGTSFTVQRDKPGSQ